MIAVDQLARALPWLLAIGVALASLRLHLGMRRQPAESRARRWRTGLLLLGQLASAALLLLLLRTSDPGDSIHTLHVLTAHAPAAMTATPLTGELWLRLPEAPSRQGIERVPDLATALRQHPKLRTLHVTGDGLEARDRDAAIGLDIRFERATLAIGITDTWAPTFVRSGDTLHVRGAAHGGARIELLDPAGVRVDQQTLQTDGAFSLRSATRSPGLATYQLRLRDAGGKAIASMPTPLQVQPAHATRLLLRSGGPDPELKFLRRWAADNGANLRASIELGGGMQAGDPAVPLDAATLADTDVLILDDRSWNGLGRARRTTVLTAVGAGMGLLLRTAAPLADGDALGMQVRATNIAATFKLPVVISDDKASALPVLTRQPLRIDNSSGPTVLRDDRGTPLAAWRAHGRGRIGVWLPIDTYRLVLAGHADLHAGLWATAINAVSRPSAATPRDMPLQVYAGERVVLCDLGDAPRVLPPGDAKPVRLTIDPRSGTQRCGAFWPQREGWHLLNDAGADTAFLVRAADADLALRASRTQLATAALAARSPATSTPQLTAATTSLPRWPLFLLWLAVTAALWWFERSRIGRVRTTTTG
ncbi:MAG: hypothetical protein ABIQ62_09060 [Thermomonas sp.]